MKDFKNLKIAYVGGGSRGWARNLINDLAKEPLLAGSVYLYDIDFEAASGNAVIGNNLTARNDVVGKWEYKAVKSISEALTDADFVVLSILPGTFDQMESDVHLPEKYGIYQSVGDSVGVGGIVRAMRTIPFYIDFAKDIEKYCPSAWVINFTNPMTLCVRALYKAFPKIKAFGCCHEVFGVAKLFVDVVKQKLGKEVEREDIKLNVLGVNHFTWIDQAKYQGVDLMPLFSEFVEEHPNGIDFPDDNWANSNFTCMHKVKFDLFKRYGILGAAGDRHLAEFCPGKWYLESPEKVKEFGFKLTTVAWRKQDLKTRIENTNKLVAGEKFELKNSGEESVRQIKAILGLEDLITNVNLPNVGQMQNVPLGVVVETNAYFSGDSVKPVTAGKLPLAVNDLVSKVICEQEAVIDGIFKGDYKTIFNAFCQTPNNCLSIEKSKELFVQMLENTKEYLPDYDNRIKAFLTSF